MLQFVESYFYSSSETRSKSTPPYHLTAKNDATSDDVKFDSGAEKSVKWRRNESDDVKVDS